MTKCSLGYGAAAGGTLLLGLWAGDPERSPAREPAPALAQISTSAQTPAPGLAPSPLRGADPDGAPPGTRYVAGGSFWRGADHAQRPDERPRHRVRVSDFYLDIALVTRAEYARFASVTGYRTTAERDGFAMGSEEGMDDWEWQRIPGGSFRRPFIHATADSAGFLRDDAPVVMVSYDDAVAYCRYRGRRLPTEAEWEYAMRAGSTARYPWGESAERAPGQLGLNFWQGASHRHNERRDGYVYVSPVRAYAPNAWGFYDPVGNVWQWTADFYAADSYARAAAADTPDPQGPATGSRRVLRGGSWWCGACTCQGNGLSYRGKSEPIETYNNIGFRCAVSPRPSAVSVLPRGSTACLAEAARQNRRM